MKAKDLWHKIFYPFAYPYVREYCKSHCNHDFPDSRRKKCRECSYAKKLEENGWYYN